MSDEDFKVQFEALHEEFEKLTVEARKLENVIGKNALAGSLRVRSDLQVMHGTR